MKGKPLSVGAAYGRGTVSGALCRGVEGLAALAQLWLLTRILPGAEFGRLAFVLAAVQVLAIMGSGGFERLTVFRLARSDVAPGVLAGGDLAGAALGWSVTLSSLLAAALWLGAAPVAALLGDPGLAGWLRALAWLIPVTAAAETYASWHLARQRVAEAMIANRALPALLTTALLGAAWWGGWAESGVAAALIAGRAAILCAWWGMHPVSPLRFWHGLGAGETRYVLHNAANGLVNKALRQCDLLMLLPLGGPALTAHYAVAQRLAWSLRFGMDLLAPIFTARAGQLLHARNAAALQREHDLNRAWATILGLALALPLVLEGPAILRAFGGDAAAYPVLLILLADQVLFVGLGMSGILLMMSGHSAWSLGTNLMMLGASAVLNALLIPPLGPSGAALATFSGVLSAKSVAAATLWRLERIAALDFAASCLLVNAAAALVLAALGQLAPAFAAAVCAAVLGLLLLHQAGAVRSALRAGVRAAVPGVPGAPG